ncbi:MAG: DNA recombination protein RmuC [Acidimicrobiales bacterium]
MTVALVIGFPAGVVIGAAVALFVQSSRASSQAAARAVAHASELAVVGAELAAARAALESERVSESERQAAREEARELLTGHFAEISAEMLQRNNEQFLALADARLKQTQESASGDLELKRQAIEELVAPLREQLGRYEKGLRQLELDRQGAYTGLLTQVRSLSESQDRLRDETRNLVTALRAPATRGRWGEMQLRRVVELAGMLEHCDFEEQVTAHGDDGRVRPDLIVHLPGGRRVIVDAKVPLQAFLDANEATDEAAQRVHLQSHARQLRTHVDALSKKGYWQVFDGSPEFVVAFVPGETLLSAALEQDPGLLEHAWAHNVILATPTNLIAMLRTVAASWQQELLTEKAEEVRRLGRELYKRLSVFGEHLAKTGRGLASAVDAYNKAVGSLERQVMPQARRFQELGVVAPGDKELAVLDPIEHAPRGGELAPGTPSLELVPGEPSFDKSKAVEG